MVPVDEKADEITFHQTPARTVEPEFVDGVAFLGAKRERALCIVLPHENQLDNLEMIREINRVLSPCSMQARMKEVCQKGMDTSIRYIQSKRFEIFIRDASDKGSQFWDAVVKKKSSRLPPDTSDRLIKFAIEQAHRDPRIGNSPHKFKFGNFSLILSYRAVKAQAEHVDLLAPNFQFVLNLTENSPSTNFYDLPDEERIRTVADLKRLWISMEKEGESSMSSNLASILEKSADFTALMSQYGDVFHSTSTFKKIEKRIDSLKAGTLLSLPGGVVHAGPATKSFRAVLFFSAVPKAESIPLAVEYNPDTQFSSVLLTGTAITITWRTIGITHQDRLYLLRRLAMYVRQSDVPKGWDRHFHHEMELRMVVRKMGRELVDETLDSYLAKHAAKDDLVFFHVQTSDFAGEFEYISHPDLQTIWYEDGLAYDVRVFKRREDGRVLLDYPGDFHSKIGEGWEGHQPNEHYTLEMRSNSKCFDGSNGILRATDGTEIKCFIPDNRKKRKMHS